MARLSFCVFLLIAVCCGNVFGQAARTPFSSFGIGEYYGNATASQQGMAGVGVSNPQYLYLNNINPALLVFNGLQGITTFQAGILGEKRTIKDDTNSDKSTGGNLNYLLLGFPIKSGKWVTSVGLMPYTGMNYRFTYTENVPGGTAPVTFVESGTGGINQVAWSHGVTVTRKISVGARASYLYSTIENGFQNTVDLSGNGQLVAYTPDVHQRFYYKGFAFTGAVSVHLDSLFNDKYKFNFGAVYDFKARLNTDYLQTLVRTNAATTVSTDSLVHEGGKTTIPSIMQVGVSFGRGNTWVFGVDGRFTDYSKFGFFRNGSADVQKGWRVAAGLEITPNPNSLSNYLKVITYRVGASAEEYPYLANGKALRDLGTNVGISLPVARGCSVDLSGRWGNRGSITDNGITEKYFKLYFGVTFNDRWFIKRRFD